MDDTRAELNKFKYLTDNKIDEILELFRSLGLDQFDPYRGALDFTKDIELASNLRSEGIQYTVSTSTKENG